MREPFKGSNPLIYDSCTFHKANALTRNGEVYHSGVNMQYTRPLTLKTL